MTIVHYVTRAQLDELFEVFAKPVPRFGTIDWVVPAWWYAMYATARS